MFWPNDPGATSIPDSRVGRDFQVHHTVFWNGSNYKHQLSKFALGLDENHLIPTLVLVWDGTFDFQRPNKPIEWFAHFMITKLKLHQQIEFAESWAVRIWVYLNNGNFISKPEDWIGFLQTFGYPCGTPTSHPQWQTIPLSCLCMYSLYIA